MPPKFYFAQMFTNFKKVIDRIGTLLSEIRNVCFDVTSIDSLISAELTLKDMLKSLLKSCDHDAGLRLSGNNIKRSLAIKRVKLCWGSF